MGNAWTLVGFNSGKKPASIHPLYYWGTKTERGMGIEEELTRGGKTKT